LSELAVGKRVTDRGFWLPSKSFVSGNIISKLGSVAVSGYMMLGCVFGKNGKTSEWHLCWWHAGTSICRNHLMHQICISDDRLCSTCTKHFSIFHFFT